MSLFSYYKKAVISPSLFVLIFSVTYSILYYLKSDLLSAQSIFFMILLPSLLFILLMYVLMLPILTNRISMLRNNLFWNLLSWFLLPIVYLSMVLSFDVQNRLKFGFVFGNDFIYLLFITVPFVIGLYRSFILYRQHITRPVH